MQFDSRTEYSRISLAIGILKTVVPNLSDYWNGIVFWAAARHEKEIDVPLTCVTYTCFAGDQPISEIAHQTSIIGLLLGLYQTDGLSGVRRSPDLLCESLAILGAEAAVSQVSESMSFRLSRFTRAH